MVELAYYKGNEENHLFLTIIFITYGRNFSGHERSNIFKPARNEFTFANNSEQGTENVIKYTLKTLKLWYKMIDFQFTRWIAREHTQLGSFAYFLSERNSKLRRASSRVPFMIEVRAKADDLGSIPCGTRWAVDKRAPLEVSLLERTSLVSPEVGLLVETARFEEFPFREVGTFSELNS